MNSEICNECGQSVKPGTGLFINRINDFNDTSTRVEMGKPFPDGEYICVKCDEELKDKNCDVRN